MRDSISNKISNITYELVCKFFILLGAIIMVNIVMAATLIYFSIMIFGEITNFAYITGGTFFGLMIGMIIDQKNFLRLKKYFLGIQYMRCCKRQLKVIDWYGYEKLVELYADVRSVEQDLLNDE